MLSVTQKKQFRPSEVLGAVFKIALHVPMDHYNIRCLRRSKRKSCRHSDMEPGENYLPGSSGGLTADDPKIMLLIRHVGSNSVP